MVTAVAGMRLANTSRDEVILVERILRLNMVEQALTQALAMESLPASSEVRARSLERARAALSGWTEAGAMRDPVLEELELLVGAELTRAGQVGEAQQATTAIGLSSGLDPTGKADESRDEHAPRPQSTQKSSRRDTEQTGRRGAAAGFLADALTEVRAAMDRAGPELSHARAGTARMERLVAFGLWVLIGSTIVAAVLASLRSPEHARQRRQLLENELLARAMRGIGEGILISSTGAQGSPPMIIFANRAFCRMIGHDEVDLIGKPLDVLRRHHLSEGEFSVLDTSVGEVHSFTMETVGRREDGAEFLCEWHVSPVRDAQQRVTHFVSAIRDVTERRSQEEALERSAAEIHEANLRLRQRQLRLLESERLVHVGQLFTGLAHEIESPFATAMSRLATLRARLDNLRPIMAQLERLTRDLTGGDGSTAGRAAGRLVRRLCERAVFEQAPLLVAEAATAAADVSRGLERAGSIVDELRACSDLHGAPSRPYDLNHVVDEALRRVRDRIGERTTIRARLGDLPLLDGRAGELCQAVTILLDHAVHELSTHAGQEDHGAHCRGGEIRIESFLDSDHAVLRIRDSGPGIPQEQLPELFIPHAFDPLGPDPAEAPGDSEQTAPPDPDCNATFSTIATITASAGRVEPARPGADAAHKDQQRKNQHNKQEKDERRPNGEIGRSLVVALACVRSHQGTLQVRSERGRGTAVTIRLPLKGDNRSGADHEASSDSARCDARQGEASKPAVPDG